jgi:putative FmdB family regulatory protein
MPLYEYKCVRCSRCMEVLQRLCDMAPRCVGCNVPMKKQISRTSFSLKGNGWYKDHYGLKPASPDSQD